VTANEHMHLWLTVMNWTWMMRYCNGLLLASASSFVP